MGINNEAPKNPAGRIVIALVVCALIAFAGLQAPAQTTTETRLNITTITVDPQFSAGICAMLCFPLIGVFGLFSFMRYSKKKREYEEDLVAARAAPSSSFTYTPASRPTSSASKRSDSGPALSDPYAELDRLKQMFNKNLITEAEYNRQSQVTKALLPPPKSVSPESVTLTQVPPEQSVSAQPVPEQGTARPSTLETELTKLAEMRSQGLIDEDEYKTLRQNLIKRS